MIESLIQLEVARIQNIERRYRLKSLLLPPRQISLGWDYGHPGQRLPCWLIGQSPNKDVWLIYSQLGFGPDYPWGFVLPADDSLGEDAQWFDSLEAAAEAIGLLL